MPSLSRLAGLRVRLLSLVLLALLPAMVIALFTAAETRQREREQARAEVVTLSRLAATNQVQVLEGARQTLIALAQLPEVRSGDAESCGARLAELLEQFQGYTGFAVAKPNGDLFCRSVPLIEPINVADSLSFQQALQTHDLSVGQFQIGRGTGKPNLGLCYPAVEATGQVQTVVCGGVDLDLLNQLAAETPLPEGSALVLIDRNGTILVRRPEPEVWVGQSLPEEPLIQAMLTQGEAELEVAGLDGVPRLYAITPVEASVETGLHLAVGIPGEIAFAELDQRLFRDLALLALAGLLVLGLAWWGSTTFVLRRVDRLVGATERLSQGDLTARAELPRGGGEIGQLGQAFNVMAAALQQREAERAQADEALRASEERFRTLANAAPIVIWTAAPDGAITFANDRWYEYTGLTPEENARHWPELVLHPDDRERCLTEWSRSLQTGAEYEIEVRNRRRDGEYRWFITRAVPARDGRGQITAWFGTTTDIHERKQAEESRRLLAEAGHLLSQPLDYSVRLANVARLVVPALADWCAADVLEEDETIRRVAVAHVDPAKVEMAHELQRRYPTDPAAPSGVPNVLRTGESEFYPVITDSMIEASAPDAEQQPIAKDLGLTSAMIVPLRARGQTLGALTFAWAQPGRHYTEADLRLAEELGRRAGLAVDNARLYEEARKLNAELDHRVNQRTDQLRASQDLLLAEIVDRKEALRRLEDSQEELRRLSTHLQAAREEERTRLARAIHDELGQALTGLKMDLSWLQHTLDRMEPAVHEKLRGMNQLIDTTVQSVRRISTELRPGILDDLGLAAAIEWQLGEFQKRTGLECVLHSSLDSSSLQGDIQTAVFRIFQETLTNVARHANATRVVVTLENRPGELTLQVQDNGRGITPEDIARSRSFGLLGMRERVHLLRGEIEFTGAPGLGTTVSIRIPLEGGEDGAESHDQSPHR